MYQLKILKKIPDDDVMQYITNFEQFLSFYKNSQFFSSGKFADSLKEIWLLLLYDWRRCVYCKAFCFTIGCLL